MVKIETDFCAQCGNPFKCGEKVFMLHEMEDLIGFWHVSCFASVHGSSPDDNKGAKTRAQLIREYRALNPRGLNFMQPRWGA